MVSVSDRGSGIPARDLPSIFQPFYRGTAKQVAGTGLGLTLVRRYVESMGGRVWAESVPGQGSPFAFTVPAVSQRSGLAS